MYYYCRKCGALLETTADHYDSLLCSNCFIKEVNKRCEEDTSLKLDISNIVNKEPTAEELFTKLGFTKTEETIQEIIYEKFNNLKEASPRYDITTIEFYKQTQPVYRAYYRKDNIRDNEAIPVDIQLNKAINKQLEELEERKRVEGWEQTPIDINW